MRLKRKCTPSGEGRWGDGAHPHQWLALLMPPWGAAILSPEAIPPDAMPHLFEPFFTTKEIGQGLGLGLAISTSIARDFGGSLSAANVPGGGAQFTLTLVRADVTSAASL